MEFLILPAEGGQQKSEKAKLLTLMFVQSGEVVKSHNFLGR